MDREMRNVQQFLKDNTSPPAPFFSQCLYDFLFLIDILILQSYCNVNNFCLLPLPSSSRVGGEDTLNPLSACFHDPVKLKK